MGQASIGLRALLAAAAICAFAALQLPSASGAGSPSSMRARAQELRAQNGSLQGRERAAWLSMVSLDTRLEQTQAALVRFRAKREAIAAERAEAELRLRIARRGLRVSQERLASRLRLLYERGETDPLAVLLGAGSIDGAITGLDSLNRVAVQDRDFLVKAREARKRLLVLTRTLAAREAQARQVEEATAATAAALGVAKQERARMLAGLAARRRTNASEIAALDSQARTLSAETAAVPSPGTAGRVLTVTATGYSLAGRTATGVPVGYGVVAVDPAVIPLGTRMTIPGYGEGVAADTGGAVSGTRIDLWFPTEAEALGWGTRTVTVTLR